MVVCRPDGTVIRDSVEVNPGRPVPDRVLGLPPRQFRRRPPLAAVAGYARRAGGAGRRTGAGRPVPPGPLAPADAADPWHALRPRPLAAARCHPGGAGARCHPP